MTLPVDFQFSQNNLQSYADCPRQFELRYIKRQEWPAVISEPVLEQERFIRLGYQFHQIVHQQISGLPPKAILSTIKDTDLLRWWNNYCSTDPRSRLAQPQFPEHYLAAPFTGFRLVAKFDLISIDIGKKATIIDWKTSRRQPDGNRQKQRMQSKVYPLLLVEAGAGLNNNRKISPDSIEMIYWYPEYPENPITLQYSAQQYQEDQQELGQLISEIVKLEQGGLAFPLTINEKQCLYCQYRSLCNRGDRAGGWEEIDVEDPHEVDLMMGFDFDQIGEIAF